MCTWHTWHTFIHDIHDIHTPRDLDINFFIEWRLKLKSCVDGMIIFSKLNFFLNILPSGLDHVLLFLVNHHLLLYSSFFIIFPDPYQCISFLPSIHFLIVEVLLIYNSMLELLPSTLRCCLTLPILSLLLHY